MLATPMQATVSAADPAAAVERQHAGSCRANVQKTSYCALVMRIQVSLAGVSGCRSILRGICSENCVAKTLCQKAASLGQGRKVFVSLSWSESTADVAWVPRSSPTKQRNS